MDDGERPARHMWLLGQQRAQRSAQRAGLHAAAHVVQQGEALVSDLACVRHRSVGVQHGQAAHAEALARGDGHGQLAHAAATSAALASATLLAAAALLTAAAAATLTSAREGEHSNVDAVEQRRRARVGEGAIRNHLNCAMRDGALELTPRGVRLAHDANIGRDGERVRLYARGADERRVDEP